MSSIHPLACVEPGAQLADDVVVGPFAYVGPHVQISRGCALHHHASIMGHTTIGESNEFFPHSVIGGSPQDLKYRGGPCRLVIGNHNQFREACTVHIGTEDGGGYTRIGDHNLFMVGAHIAHDCILGSRCVIANNVLLAGHVLVEDWVVLSGAVASHHFVRIGQHSFVGGMAAITRDVPPFMIVDGHPATVRGINRNGLKRRGFTDAQIEALKTAYRLLFKDTTPMLPQFDELERLYPASAEITTLLTFMREALNGKFGRARENSRGKTNWDPEQEDPGIVSGN